VLLTIYLYLSFGGSLPLSPQGYRFEVPLPQANNLLAGSEVQIAGVNVGKVANISRNGNGALATLELKPQYAPMRSGGTAIVRTKSLLGEAYVELAPGARGAPPIPDGGRLAASHVRPTVQLDEFLQTFNPNTRERTAQLFAGLATALGGRSQSLNDSLGYSAPFAGSLAAVLQTLDQQHAQLGHLVASSGNVLNALGHRTGLLQAAITAGNDVLDVTARRNRALAATVRALPPFLTQLRGTSNIITAASGDLNRAVAALLPIAPLVQPALDEIVTNVPEFRTLFRELPSTISAGNHGLPALTQILSAIPAAFRQLYPTTRQLIPLMQLFAAYREEGLVGPLANFASGLNGTTVAPGGKVIARFGGAVYLSNESLVGWVKRLPTNRENPYPTPFGFASLAQNGYLKSYDCRNIHNTLWLPPTGTGVPPCVTQGPWDYNGHSAYYPRLQPAPP
jgi:virulence factor Mce-like protein